MRKVPADTLDRTAADEAHNAPPPPAHPAQRDRVPEIGGVKGPEPTRYGDWEHNGRCTDF